MMLEWITKVQTVDAKYHQGSLDRHGMDDGHSKTIIPLFYGISANHYTSHLILIQNAPGERAWAAVGVVLF